MTEQQIESLNLRLARRQQQGQGEDVQSEKAQKEAISFNTAWREAIVLKATPAS